MSFRALYDKVTNEVAQHQAEWERAIDSLDVFRQRIYAIIQERKGDNNKVPTKKSSTQKSKRQSCGYVVNPKKVSLGKSRRKSSVQVQSTHSSINGSADEAAVAATPVIPETANALEAGDGPELRRSVHTRRNKPKPSREAQYHEEPAVAKNIRSVRTCRNASAANYLELNSPQEPPKEKKRRARAKKQPTSKIPEVPDTPESKKVRKDSQEGASSDQCLTPRRSLGSLIPMQESRKLGLVEQSPRKESELSEDVERDQGDKRNRQKAERTLGAKHSSSSSRQIFSPYSLDSIKKKAQAYEDHIAKHAASDVPLNEPSDRSASKRSLTKPCNKLIFAKAARMSQTQRRSSLVRYHMQVALNQQMRKESLERRRSSINGAAKRKSCQGSQKSIPEEPVMDDMDVTEDIPQQKYSKKSGTMPFVAVEKMDATFVLPKPGSSRNSRTGSCSTNDRDSIDRLFNPQVCMERLSEKQIAKLSGASVQPAVRGEASDSDSYTSDDEPVASTPLVTHFTAKVPLSMKTIRPLTAFPGSEPRPANKERLTYLYSMLNSSNPGTRLSGTATGGRQRVTSFLKSRAPSQDFTVKKMDKRKEDLKKKEELAFRRREQMLKEKVLSQKKKLDEKMAKVAENRLQREKEQQGKNRALELQLLQTQEKQRLQAEKRREEIEQKRLLRAKKETEIEERRRQEEAAKLAKIKEQEALEKLRLQEQEQLKAAITQHNTSLQKKAILNSTVVKEKEKVAADHYPKPPASMNETYNCDEGSQQSEKENNYDITPHRSELPPEELKDPDNYDIADLNSGDETDDDNSPKKKIPNWAQGFPLKNALIQQHRKPPIYEVLFPPMPNIDIAVVFHNGKPKKKLPMRTSSAVWHSPINS